jgi:hypothetical protein
MENGVRRLEELNAAIDVAVRELRKLIAERDRLELELGLHGPVSPGDPIEGGVTSPADFVVPWAPEEDAL